MTELATLRRQRRITILSAVAAMGVAVLSGTALALRIASERDETTWCLGQGSGHVQAIDDLAPEALEVIQSLHWSYPEQGIVVIDRAGIVAVQPSRCLPSMEEDQVYVVE